MKTIEYKCKCGNIIEKDSTGYNTYPTEIKCECGCGAKRIYSALAFKVNGHNYSNGYNK